MEYTYLIGSLIVLFFWFILYFSRKDVRKEMLFMSIMTGLMGLILELIWTQDWWRPMTITGTLIGIEDFIFGFGVGGFSGSIYEELFKKKMVKIKRKEHPHTKQLIILSILSFIILLTMFFFLKIPSFYATLFATLIPTFIIYFFRHDLILDSLVTGFLLTIFSIFGFAVLNIIQPDFVYSWWFIDKLTGIVILGVPLEDLIWFFTTGMYLAPIYEFWQGLRLKNMK